MGIALGAVFGAVLGSFLNVVVYRFPKKISLVSPPSACPACGTPIKPYDNVPVVSYILLRGRCRHCRAPISIRYPLVEAATAGLGAGAAARFHAAEPAAFVFAGGAVLLVLALIDVDTRRVPNMIVLPATAAVGLWVLGLAAAKADWSIAVHSFASGAAGFVLFFLIALLSGGMGMGDVKLAAFIGLYTGRFGWEVFVLAVFAGFFLGGIVAACLLITGRRGRKDALPFVPALAAGGLIAAFWGSAPVRAWLGL
jgi:leader peptidase (prepilin peptidase)/N-methyltransferase